MGPRAVVLQAPGSRLPSSKVHYVTRTIPSSDQCICFVDRIQVSGMYDRDGYGQLGVIRAAYMACFEHRTAKRPARAEYCFRHWLDLHFVQQRTAFGISTDRRSMDRSSGNYIEGLLEEETRHFTGAKPLIFHRALMIVLRLKN